MYTLHGFMVINNLIDNTLNTVSPLGELSPKSRSYSKEIGIYSHQDYDDVRLFTFYSKEDNIDKPLTDKLATPILALGNWLAIEAGLGRINDQRNTFIQKLNAEYGTRITVKQVGKMATNGQHWLPEYITFSLIADKRENTYRIWFADDAFRNQYDKYQIVVIPPIANIDDFHKGKAAVIESLNRHDITDLHKRTNVASDSKPYTYIMTNEYAYINPRDQKDNTMTPWTVIIYGEAGNNADIIRDSIAAHVLANSDYNRTQWEKIIPDIFVPTEFYITPFWTKFATENLQLRGGIHSPVIPVREIVPWAVRNMYGYTQQHIENNAVIFDTIYKSLAMVVCGHPKNRAAPVRFEEAWPDYCNIYTTSRDFNRISPETQDFIMVLNKLLLEAETMTPDSEVPLGMSRVERGGVWYIAESFQGTTYLVTLRYNYLNEITNDQSSSIVLPTVSNTGSTTTESSDRISDIINMTPDVNGTPSTVRGRTTSTLEETSGNGGITTQAGVINGTQSTSAAVQAGTP